MSDNQNVSPDVRFEDALLAMDRVKAQNLFSELGEGLQLIQQVEQMIIPALNRIGSSWEKGNLALSQVYMSGRICEELVNKILLHKGDVQPNQPKIAIAVLDDYHLLGKRMVYSTLRSSGYTVHDFGRQDVDSLVQRVISEQVEMMLISTLMLPSALRVADVRKKLREKGSSAKIIVGGAPFRFDSDLWREVGADAMGFNASDVVSVITAFTGGE